MKKIFILFLLIGCGPQYAQDPNAYIVVTSQYENEPEKTIPNNNCKSQLDCKNKSEAECAVALYHDSERFIKQGKIFTKKELYLSAMVEYMQASSRLIEAEIRLKKAKTESYEAYKVVIALGLEKQIKNKINFCKRQMHYLKWRK
tara:strand:- start:6587 stop:7021 length:435 start_codon:yes stop_codon:yes gene_type:complete